MSIPNIPLAVLSASCVAILLFLRSCSWFWFTALVVVPAGLYAYFAERTRCTIVDKAVVVVTGGSSGLGLAFAIDAAKRGAAVVVLVARNETKLRDAAKEVEAASQSNVTVAVIPTDLTDPKAIEAMVTKTVSDHGVPDLVINNAGAGAWNHVENTSPETALFDMACPYQAAFGCTTLFVPHMAKAGKGHFLNVTSAASIVGLRGAVSYGASRWAMRGFSRMLSSDLKETGLGVTHLNAAEITGTDYFKNAPGKAGSSSHAMIPDLFKFVDKIGMNYNTQQVAQAALSAVEKGWSVIHVPGHIVLPCLLLPDYFLDVLCRLGGAGLRKKGN